MPCLHRFVGRLVADPIYYSPDSRRKERTWGRIMLDGGDAICFSAFGKNARIIRDHCKKGKEINILGEMRNYSSMCDDFYEEIIVERLELGRNAKHFRNRRLRAFYL